MRTPAQLFAVWKSLGRRVQLVLVACAVVGLISFGVQLVEIPARSALRGSDNSFNYFWLRSLMVDGDWDFRNDIEACNTLTPEYREASLRLELTPAGRIPNKYGVGWALVSLPFYLVADGIVAVGRTLGVWSLERDGYNAVYQICLQTGHAMLAMFALGLAYRLVRRWCEREASLLGVALIWAASPLLYYQTSNLSMSHGVTFLAVTLCAWASAQTRDRPRRGWLWVVAGAGLGLAVITRFQAAVYGLIPLWAWLACVGETRSLREAVKSAGALMAGAAPFIALQLWAWKVVYGAWLVFSYGANDEGFNWLSPEFGKVLFSPYHGLFYWHPLLMAGAVGLIALAWRQRGVMVAATVSTGVMIYVNAAWWCWWFGASFGGRAFDAAILFFMAGLAWIFSRLSSRAGGVLLAGGAMLAVWNIVMLALYRFAAIPRNDPVTYADAIRAIRTLLN